MLRIYTAKLLYVQILLQVLVFAFCTDKNTFFFCKLYGSLFRQPQTQPNFQCSAPASFWYIYVYSTNMQYHSNNALHQNVSTFRRCFQYCANARYLWPVWEKRWKAVVKWMSKVVSANDSVLALCRADNISTRPEWSAANCQRTPQWPAGPARSPQCTGVGRKRPPGITPWWWSI